MPEKVLVIAALIGATLLLVVLYATGVFAVLRQCIRDEWRGNQVTLKNHSGHEIVSGTLIARDKTYAIGRIEVGKSIDITIPATEAGLQVAVVFHGGRKLKSEQMGYFTSCMSVHDTIDVQPLEIVLAKHKIVDEL